jgi:hypothetical protein
MPSTITKNGKAEKNDVRGRYDVCTINAGPTSLATRGPTVFTSVHIVEGLHNSLSMGPERSQPIPIKNCRPSSQEAEEEDTDISSHYELATLRMYILITTARRLRAISRSRNSIQLQKLIMMDQDCLATANGQVHHPEKFGLPSCAPQTSHLSTADEDTGVFVLDWV